VTAPPARVAPSERAGTRPLPAPCGPDGGNTLVTRAPPATHDGRADLARAATDRTAVDQPAYTSSCVIADSTQPCSPPAIFVPQ